MQHDDWDTRITYTWFRSKARGQTKGSVTSAFLGARLSLLEPFSTGKAHLNLNYNMLDWDLGRNFLASKFLSIRPAIGLRGGWITQKIHSDWTTPNFLNLFFLSAKENLHQRFKGIGPKGAVSGKWCFGDVKTHSFSLLYELDADYLWGHWTIRDKFSDNLSTEIHVITTDRNFGSFVVHCFFGFAWDVNFYWDRMHFGLQLGYEIEDWYNQCQIFTDTSGSQNNDLILQGLNLGLNIDF